MPLEVSKLWLSAASFTDSRPQPLRTCLVHNTNATHVTKEETNQRLTLRYGWLCFRIVSTSMFERAYPTMYVSGGKSPSRNSHLNRLEQITIVTENTITKETDMFSFLPSHPLDWSYQNVA